MHARARRRRIVALAGAVLIAVLAFVATSRRGDDAPVAVEPTETPAASTDAPGEVRATSRPANPAAAPQRSALNETLRPAMPTPSALATAPKTERAPMPPADTPLIEILDALTRRTDAGDPAAACRLAAELIRCSHRAALVADINSDAFRTDPSSKRHIASSEHRGHKLLAEANRICAGVPATRINEAFRRTMDAADLGHPGARSWVALYGEGESVRHLFDQPELARRWQRSAPRWAIASLDEGDRRLGGIWAMVAYSPMETPISALVEADPALRLALLRYAALREQREGEPAHRLAESEARDLAATLPPDAIALAERTAQQWVAAMGPRLTSEELQSTNRLTPAERLMTGCARS
jgi:hypothetical protein